MADDLQSRASLDVSASTSRANFEVHDGKGAETETASDVNGSASGNAIAEISAELQRERQKNAELMQRISLLEAQLIRETTIDDSKPKRQKVSTNVPKIEDENITTDLGMKHSNSHVLPVKEIHVKNRLVNWINIDDTTTECLQHSDILKDRDTTAEYCEDTDDTDNEDDDHKEVIAENDINFTSVHQGCIRVFATKDEPKDVLVDGNYASLQKKHLKIAFCPKEVKRIIESEEILLKNAHSHTIRKIIVFASLGIRHGCEDIYELDFNHFAILQKGQPYLSSKDPGEHVLYENPGIRRKIFYPNRQNPTLCPVQILEEEKGMRPSDANCPSFLFLCIKYGGRTRNIPQNEYVRQRMGRNKLKSFGPAICRMGMLVHIRSGSFFFKALGITLLFMAGFPDDLVQRETKYTNLDLLHKYYRSDEDVEGEELFLSHSTANDTDVSPISEQVMRKKMSGKSKSRKSTKIARKEPEKASILQASSSPSNSRAHSIPEITQADSSNPNPPIANQQSLYPIFPPHPPTSFFPVIYWPPPNAFFPCPPPPPPHPSSQYPLAGNYISSYPQPFYGNPLCNNTTTLPKPLEDSWKDEVAAYKADNYSKSSSTSTQPTTEVEKITHN